MRWKRRVGIATAFAVPPQTIEAFQQFIQETRYAQDSDREYRTLQNLNQLAAFLGSFPGRKNVIWMSGAFPLELFGQTSLRFEGSIDKTINLLSAARVAIYPVDVRGTNVPTFYTAENTLDPSITSAPQTSGTGARSNGGCSQCHARCGQGGFAGNLLDESQAKNSSDSTMDMLASMTGGKAFYNQNDLSGIIGKVSDHSSDFYTISYSPTNSNMDGLFRKIEVKVGDGEHYTLSYRRGYYARDEDLPGAAQSQQEQAAQQASQNPTRIDPLEPFMVFGMPQSEQILYKTLIQPMPQKADEKPSPKGPSDRYSVDLALDLNDLHLKLDPDGSHKGRLNLSMILYNKYGQVTSREDHLVDLSIKPDVYAVFQKTGVQLHGEISVPKGQYWLRTGVYDEASRKVGTMEIPLSSVKESIASQVAV